MQCGSVVILRSNPIAPDPRVEKEAKTLDKSGYEVIVVGWDRTGKLPHIETHNNVKIERISLPAEFGAGVRNLPYLLRWQFRLLIWLWKNRKKYQIIHACDFDTILPAFLMKFFYGKKIVYDVFDFYADMLRKTPNFLCNIIRKIDLWVMGKVDALILADEMRIDQIRGARPRRIEFIYNSPETYLPTPIIRFTQGRLRIAYVGLLQVERGLLEMLEVMKRHPEWELYLAGFGGDSERILTVAKNLPNVRIYGRIPYEKALELYSEADVLFATYDPKIPNHRYSSANKLFEAMMLGKPIIVARGTGMDKIVEKYKLGFVVTYGDINQIENALEKLALWDQKQWEDFSLYVKNFFKENYSWEIMEKRLVNLYKCL